MIRIVGLSATLPNYLDVAGFLRVNPRVGLFYFDSRFRPVPLGQTFIGVKGLSLMEQQRQMDSCCFEKVLKMVTKGHQVNKLRFEICGLSSPRLIIVLIAVISR